jgi:hypothetical protein
MVVGVGLGIQSVHTVRSVGAEVHHNLFLAGCWSVDSARTSVDIVVLSLLASVLVADEPIGARVAIGAECVTNESAVLQLQNVVSVAVAVWMVAISGWSALACLSALVVVGTCCTALDLRPCVIDALVEVSTQVVHGVPTIGPGEADVDDDNGIRIYASSWETSLALTGGGVEETVVGALDDGVDVAGAGEVGSAVDVTSDSVAAVVQSSASGVLSTSGWQGGLADASADVHELSDRAVSVGAESVVALEVSIASDSVGDLGVAIDPG